MYLYIISIVTTIYCYNYSVSLACTTCSLFQKKTGDELDSDVVDEKQRVLGQGLNDSLVVQRLSKYYRLHNLRRTIAVNDLTFGVQPGEVWSLCGCTQFIVSLVWLRRIRSHLLDMATRCDRTAFLLFKS